MILRNRQITGTVGSTTTATADSSGSMFRTVGSTNPVEPVTNAVARRRRNRSRRVSNPVVVEPVTNPAIKQTRRNRNRNRNRTNQADNTLAVEPAIVEPTTIRPISRELKQSMYRQLNPTTRQTNLLKTLCPESGDCVILGKHIDLLKEYFNNFKSNIKSIKMIGAPSVNGFINEITYSKNNYEAYCILKSSQRKEADNLYYEWYIGKFFINKFVPKFPCFVETYSLGFYETPYYYNLFKQNTNVMQIPRGILDKDDFSFKNIDDADETTFFANISCDVPTDFCVLIQHMKNPISFADFISRNKATEYGFNIDIFQIFLQIFIPLGVLSDSFTHNDLHTNNVLLYTIPNNKYIVLNYKFNGFSTKIKTRYIAKIIDYGRSFFKWDGLSSANFYNTILTDPACKTKKDDNGYTWFAPVNSNAYYISQTEGNISKDLWLPGIYWSTLGKYNGHQQLTTDIRHVFDTIIGGGSKYISIPPTKSPCQVDTVCNVRTFVAHLVDIYEKNEAYINQKYDEVLTGGCIGELTIFATEFKKDSIFTASTSMSGGRKVKRKTKTKKRVCKYAF